MLKIDLRVYSPVILCTVVIVILLFTPTTFEKRLVFLESDICRAKVISVDNSAIFDTGLLRTGDQALKIKVLNGKFKGNITAANNTLIGSLERDKIFRDDDLALVRLNSENGVITNVSVIDHYRIHYEIILALSFIALLIIFAGLQGLRALLSFVLCVLTIWKVLVPLYLKGVNPIFSGAVVAMVLDALIILLVYGVDKRSASAVAGSFLGIVVTIALSFVATRLLKIHGAVMVGSEGLLYSGFSRLNLTGIFIASVFIGSSGAVTDLAVDITSAVSEVVKKKPDIKKCDAIKSGFFIGRAAMGTMTTTLLFAYTGCYVTLLMTFMAQGTPLINILNYKYVASEVVHTIVGTFGLVTTAPFSALCAGVILVSNTRKKPAPNLSLKTKTNQPLILKSLLKRWRKLLIINNN